jgi:hypothetical protein
MSKILAENSGGKLWRKNSCGKFRRKILAENLGGKFWRKILAENLGGKFRRLTKFRRVYRI